MCNVTHSPLTACLHEIKAQAPGWASEQEYEVTLMVVQGDDVQAVQQLPLMLMDPLHMHVEHGVGVDSHIVLLLQEGRELSWGE